MIIKFSTIRDSFYTPEELDRLEELQEEKKKLDIDYRREHGAEFDKFQALYNSDSPIDFSSLEGWRQSYYIRRSDLLGEAFFINKNAKERYREAKGTEGILEDIRTIVEAYTKEDYKAYLKGARDRLKAHNSGLVRISYSGLTEEETQELLEENAKDNFINLYFLLMAYVSEAFHALNKEDKEARAKAVEIIKARCIELGYKEEPLKIIKGEEASELPALPRVDFVYPTNFQQNLTKASSTIFNSKNSLEDLKQIAIDVSPNKKGLTTTYSVNVDLTAPELKGTENITEYDKSVHNMAISMAKANKGGCFTAKQLATALLYGDNPSNSRPSPQQIGAVTKSIEKQRHIDITIDWTEHAKLNNKGELPEEVTAYQRKGYMLPVEEHIFTINGKTLTGYHFIKEPPLYQYAMSVGQIGQHPAKMLNVPINLDQTKIVIRDFLLEEIAHIKKRESWNKTISVDRLLEVAGEDSQTISRKKKSALLQAVEEMLNYWAKEEKDKEGNITKESYIKGYTKNRANTTGKPLQSFTIEV